jgi:ribonuclease E
VLDEPTDSTTSSPDEESPAPAKAPRRRRATKAAAAPAAAAEATDSATTDSAATDSAATGPSPAEAEAPPAPAKRARKAPAKKAAPRKRTAKKAADPAPAAEPESAEIPLTEEELAAQAALLEAGEAVVTPVEDDPVVAAAAAADVTTPAVTPPAEDAPAPAKRTRTRRATSVTFQAPEPAADAEPGAAAPAGPAEDTDEAPAPRRRRRAGTSGAVSPSALVPELLEPAAPAAQDDEGPRADAEADEDEGEDRPRRRRRGRRGRGARRPEDEDSTAADDAASGTSTPAAGGDEAGSGTGSSGDNRTDSDRSEDEDEDAPSGTRRRRRRRRSGGGNDGDEGAAGDEPAAQGTREPRTRSRSGSGATSADEDGVRGITGSTRMAAKRVRRQEGRDSGRGRKPILSEAEFLARREAVDRTMIVRQKGDRTQIAVLEDGILVEHYVTKASAQSYAGNVYLGRVQNVLPSMEAAFVDIGKSRNAVLYAGEVNYNAAAGGRNRSIESVLKSGQEVLVQVSKDPIGHKGARLTGQVSLPGRYLVYVPEGSMTGISRKLPEVERERLKKILKKVVPDDAGVIIRTAAEGASEEEISADVRRLQAQWEVLQTKAAKGGAPVLLHAEPDLVIRVVRDVFNEDFTKLVVQGDSEWDTIREYVEFVAPDLAPRLSRHTSEKDVFAEHRVDEQLLKALDRKVYLPSGGSLVIDRTEAMVVIDVNTGKFVGKGGNLEETVTRNNLEAAEEIARQLRLRDVGGIIVVDFIDMVLESNRDLVVRRLVECLGRDRTKHQVAEVTSLGLVQMTRKRVGQGLLESFSETCESCNGRGVHVHTEPVNDRRGGGGGGGDETRRERAPKRKPTPPDAPKPRALAQAPAAAASDSAGSDSAGSDSAGSDSAGSDSAGSAEDATTTPRRRRRGGRGAGSATVRPEDEMAELLGDASPAEAQAVTAATEHVDAVTARTAAPETTPELADQPTAAQEDLPVDAAPNEVVGATVDADLEIGTGLPVPAPDADAAAPGVDEVAAGTAAAPAAEPAPRRRRRATSRPAGPPPAV